VTPPSRSRLARGVLALLLIAPAGALAQSASPVGMWRTFDDRTGKERGLVRIYEANGRLYGNVEATIDPAEAKRTCTKCEDDRKDRPLIGLNIIRGLHRDGDAWDGGTILDPGTGEVYRCSIHLEDGGRRLVVRGYLGISLLGRSQTWVRAG
jgi:uncharacterized protein (DUF2147 family)